MKQIIETEAHRMTYAAERVSAELAERNKNLPEAGKERRALVNAWLEAHPEVVVGACEGEASARRPGFDPDGWTPLACGGSVLCSRGVPVRLSDGGAPEADSFEEAATQVPGESAIREEVEELLGVWIDVGDVWAPAGEGVPFEAVAPCELSAEQPTHRIVFTPLRGKVSTWLVQLDAGTDGDGPAYDHDEATRAEGASWGVSGGRWFCEGRPTPDGASGEVTVGRLR
jgi:hypothetical protein